MLSILCFDSSHRVCSCGCLFQGLWVVLSHARQVVCKFPVRGKEHLQVLLWLPQRESCSHLVCAGHSLGASFLKVPGTTGDRSLVLL